MGYVIFLSSGSDIDDSLNAYGYWEGKTYTKHGEIFPTAYSTKITKNTKVYTSKLRANNMAEKLVNRCSYILSWRVEEVPEYSTQFEYTNQ